MRVFTAQDCKWCARCKTSAPDPRLRGFPSHRLAFSPAFQGRQEQAQANPNSLRVTSALETSKNGPCGPQEEDDNFSEVLPALHSGAVAGADGAVRRPLAVTAGADRAVRLWNHATRCASAASRRLHQLRRPPPPPSPLRDDITRRLFRQLLCTFCAPTFCHVSGLWRHDGDFLDDGVILDDGVFLGD